MGCTCNLLSLRPFKEIITKVNVEVKTLFKIKTRIWKQAKTQPFIMLIFENCANVTCNLDNLELDHCNATKIEIHQPSK